MTLGPAALGGMSDLDDPSFPPGASALSGHPPYDRPPRQALDEMPAEVRAAWRNRYLAEAGRVRLCVLLAENREQDRLARVKRHGVLDGTTRPLPTPSAIKLLTAARPEHDHEVGKR